MREISDLGMQWYAVPIISDMALLIGGIRYSAAPFNGWYMGTEIGARNLADTNRYNMLAAVADAMGLSRTSDATLWRDKALVELNLAVLHSFRKKGLQSSITTRPRANLRILSEPKPMQVGKSRGTGVG
ncbi:hypothetical protein GCM10025858_27720 [Alicyclobacillus sacchari]|nr:hypothetical protein GCM10025858_27720 [Alicyclobacillus sacchari]